MNLEIDREILLKTLTKTAPYYLFAITNIHNFVKHPIFFFQFFQNREIKMSRNTLFLLDREIKMPSNAIFGKKPRN